MINKLGRNANGDKLARVKVLWKLARSEAFVLWISEGLSDDVVGTLVLEVQE